MNRTVNLIKRISFQLIGPSLALLISFSIGGVFILLIGKNPLEVYQMLFTETLGNSYGIGQVLFKATPLIFTGLSAAIAFRAGLFNIGAEGQLVVGAFLTGITGFLFSPLPSFILLPLCLFAGITGGAIWGMIPGFMKAKFGAHEVINTIMMNFIAVALVSYMMNNHFAVPATIHTPLIAPAAELPRLDSFSDTFRGSPVNMSLFIALLLCFVIYHVLWKTRLGYEFRVMGLSPTAAEYAKINLQTKTVLAMAIAGGCAGLVGSNYILGYKHYYELGSAEGVGFVGIAVALLGRNHPAGIIAASFFFGILEYGGLTINTIVPKELMNIMQAVVIIFVVVLSKLLDRWLTRSIPVKTA